MNHSTRKQTPTRQARRRSERGYALIAIIGVMMFSLILMTTVAPRVQLEVQREKEEEMLWRGHQIALALAQYPPATSLKQLIDGVPMPGSLNKRRLLRPSAICDPMHPCDPSAPNGNWRVLRAADPLHKELFDALDETAREQRMPALDPRQNPQLVQLAQRGASQLPGQEADTKLDGESRPDTVGDTDESKLEGRPIVGVVSRKTGRMFRSYYSIDEYDHVLFFPRVQVMAGGFLPPGFAPGLVGGFEAQRRSDCPGGVILEGKCTGAPTNRRLCHGPDGSTIPCP